MTSPCMAADPVGSPLLHKPPKMVCTAMPRRPSYKGALSPSDVVAGMAAARRNARRLAEDAQLLLDQGRWASASSLAVLSIEESGKVGVLRRLSLASEAPDLKAGWDGYGSHRRKLGHPLGLGEVFVPNALLSLADALTEAIDRRAETVASMDARKQAGFYTDCVPDPSGRPFWVEPTAAITPDHARTVVGCAAILLEHREVTMREIELFVEHVGPVLNRPGMVEGWRTWMRAMATEGLLGETVEAAEDRMLDSAFGHGWRDGI